MLIIKNGVSPLEAISTKLTKSVPGNVR